MSTIFLWTAHYNMFWHVKAFLVQCKIEFYFTHEPQNLYFHWWFPPLVNILHLVFIRWNKIQSDCEKIKISSTYYGISRACVNEIILMTSLQKKKTKPNKQKKQKQKKKNVDTPKITHYMLIPVHFSSILVRSPSTVKCSLWQRKGRKFAPKQAQNTKHVKGKIYIYIYIRPAPTSWDELTFCSSGFS